MWGKRGIKNPIYGIKRSKETREKLSKARTGISRPQTIEERQKRSKTITEWHRKRKEGK